MTKSSLRDILNTGKQILKNGGVEDYAFDSACLFEHFCKITKTDLVLGNKQPTPEKVQEFLDACKRRAGGNPLQYILGHWEFYGLDFIVNESVLIPRADTETLIDYILKSYSGKLRILDMCCGSGCIGLTLKKHLTDAHVTLCDISDGALAVARQNADALGVDVQILKADVLDGYEKYFGSESFDVIVSNPPYIKDNTPLSIEVMHEPGIALYGGEDGLKFYRVLITDWMNALRYGGELILESGYDTWQDICALFTECEWRDITTTKDLNNIERLVSAKR